MPPPPTNKAWLRDYEPPSSPNKALLSLIPLGGHLRFPWCKWSVGLWPYFIESITGNSWRREVHPAKVLTCIDPTLLCLYSQAIGLQYSSLVFICHSAERFIEWIHTAPHVVQCVIKGHHFCWERRLPQFHFLMWSFPRTWWRRTLGTGCTCWYETKLFLVQLYNPHIWTIMKGHCSKHFFWYFAPRVFQFLVMWS